MAVPAGYLKDSGEVFAVQGNGFSYGWGCDFTAGASNRYNQGTRESSLVIPNREMTNCANNKWEIELPNGAYEVVVGYSDLQYPCHTSGCSLQGQSASVGTLPAGHSKTKTMDVVVDDGKLALAGSYANQCTSFSFIHITTRGHEGHLGGICYPGSYHIHCPGVGLMRA